METSKTLIATLAATLLLGSAVAWAADEKKPTAQQSAADKDFGKLSTDGSNAFQDLTLTRIAIYDGRVDDAKKYITRADTTFTAARADEAAFIKAEADLKPAPGTDAPAHKSATTAATTGAASSDSKQPDQATKPIRWLPVDGAIMINEDYTANPSKTSAVADANKTLKGGDRKAAMERLKLADISIEVTLAVVPLEETITDVHKAAELIADGKYYQASQVLRQVQDTERFDVTTVPGASRAGK